MKHLKTIKNHEDCRKVICLLCFKSSKDLRKLSQNHVSRIKHYAGVDSSDARLPNAICSSCRKKLQKCNSSDQLKNSFDLLEVNKIKNVTNSITTRSSLNVSCKCIVCIIARQSGRISVITKIIKTKRLGRPPKIQNAELCRQTVKVCDRCLSNISKGVSHKCNKKTIQQNLKSFINKIPQNHKEQLAVSIVKEKLSTECAISSGEQTKLATRSERLIPLIVPKKKKTENQMTISAFNFIDIQSNLNLSTNQTLKLASNLRKTTNQRNTVEKNFKKKIQENSHNLDNFFSSIEMNFQKSGEIIKQTAVFCNNVNLLLDFIFKKRNYEPGTQIKIGIDGGGGFIKICITFITQSISTQHNKFADSSVKKLLIIGIVADVPETYSNILQMWNVLKLNNLQKYYYNITFATDLKLANILTGLMSHTSAHPCKWCDVNKLNINQAGEHRTIANIVSKYNDWVANGAKTIDAKKFANCINKPIITGNITNKSDTKILYIIPPPELHLMLGVVNKIFDTIMMLEPEVAANWAKLCCVNREAYHGGNFNGNSCRILVKKVDLLESICPLNCLKYVQVLRDFNNAVSSCFGKIIDANYKQIIDRFKENYIASGMNITPKVHAVFFHVVDFCENKNLVLVYIVSRRQNRCIPISNEYGVILRLSVHIVTMEPSC